MSNNLVWINTPTTIYGASTPITLTDVRKTSCFTSLSIALEYAGNTPANLIELKVTWFDQNQLTLFTETLVSSTSSSTNLSAIVSVKGAYAVLQLVGSINPTFNASTQAILKHGSA